METNNETRKEYEAPFMEIVEIRVEQGFQMSGASVEPASEPFDPLKGLIR